MLYFDPEFRSFYKKLPPSVQKQTTKALSNFSEDQHYKSLHFKCVNRGHARYSIRINDNYRALSYKQDGKFYWYWVGHHDMYIRKIGE